MSLITSIKKKTTLKAATKQIFKARKAETGKADQLYKTAYEGFEFVLNDNLMLADALYHWGFGLLNQAKTKKTKEAIELYYQAIDKYKFCSVVEPYYLGASMESGVAYMAIARLKGVVKENELYQCAKEYFERASDIQKGSGAYNLACLYSVQNNVDACLSFLKEAKDFAHLPDEQEILNDPDMKNVCQSIWFIDFIDTIKAEKFAEKQAIDEKKKRQALAKLKKNGATEIEVSTITDQISEPKDPQNHVNTSNNTTQANT